VPYSSLNAVSAAVQTTLNVSTLTSVATGGLGDEVPPDAAFPFVLFKVSEDVLGGFGSKPGTGKRTLQVDLRVHVFSTHRGMKEAQTIMAIVIGLLADAPSVTGFGSWAIFHDGTVPLPNEVVNGIAVRELVGNFRLMISES
jgi:hypothetical protein